MYDGEDFLRELGKRLSAAGMQTNYDGMYLRVAGCAFEAQAKAKGRGKVLIRFLGSVYSEGKRGEYDYDRAVAAVIRALPQKLQERAKVQRKLQLRDALRERFGTASEPWQQNGAAISYSEDGIYITVCAQSIEEMDMVLSYLNTAHAIPEEASE